MVRAAAMADTKMGRRVRETLASGTLVSDGIMIDIVRESIAYNLERGCKGIVFDGFPRTVEQAMELDKMLRTYDMRINQVANFQIPDSVLVERVTGRRIHKDSGRSYHIKFNPPKNEGFDDVTNQPLTKRQDDNETTLVTRLSAFHAQTKPVIAHYDPVIVNIDATSEMNEVWSAIDLALFGTYISESFGVEHTHQEVMCDAKLQETWAEGEYTKRQEQLQSLVVGQGTQPRPLPRSRL
jgi:adenylate kinase